MTPFSAYASRFLASGASAGPIQQPSSSLAFNNSLYRPYKGYDEGSDEEEDNAAAGLYEDDEAENGGDRSSGLTETKRLANARKSQHRHQLPHLSSKLAAQDARSGGSSIFNHFRPASIQQGNNTPRGRRMEDIEDEDVYDDDDAGTRNGRGVQQPMLSSDKGGQTGDSSILENSTANPSYSQEQPDDDHNPFLAEADLERNSRKAGSGSRKTLPGPSHSTKARGWMVHGGTESSASSARSEASDTPSAYTASRRKALPLPHDIYRDPDDEYVDNSMASSRQDKRGAKAGPSHRRAESGDRTSQSSSSEMSDDERDERLQGRRHSRRGTITKAAGSIGSSLREPLLSSAGSEVLDGSRGGRDRPPGAYRGSTSRISSSDIYTYPHPPAKQGWTPWAPGNRVPLRQYKDKLALLAWLGAASGILVLAGVMALSTQSVAPPGSPSTRPSPYYTLTRSIPILFLLTFLSVGAAVANLVFLRNIQRVGGGHILRYGLIGVPLILGLGWIWAFAGSFIYDDERWSGGGWSTTGLRVISLFPLFAAIFFARSVWKRRDALSRSLSVLELSAQVVAAHPSLLVLSLVILAGFLLVTAPFLTIFVRLFLRGHFGGPGTSSSVWHTDANARVIAWLTLGVWLWTWLVLRGIQRVTIAGVVSHWYFHRVEDNKTSKVFERNDEDQDAGAYDTLPGPAPGQWLGEEQMDDSGIPSHLSIVRASFVRATGPALGTICISALMLSAARTATLIAAFARWMHRKMSASSRIPAILQPMTHVVALLAGIGSLIQGMSDYALVYVGVTGDGFAPAARRSSRLVSRQSVKSIMDGLVINTLLDLTTLALCFLTGVAGFLFSAHNLHVPADAPLVGLLCALLPYWTLRLCADVLTNAADTLYLCFSIDEASGEQHCKEAVEAVSTGQA